MPADGDISIDMATSRELAGATSFVPMGVSEAYRGDAYDPKTIVEAPMLADDEDDDIKTLKEYFAKPTKKLKKMLGNKKYAGCIDNKKDLELCLLAADLEEAMGNIIDEDLSGLVIEESPDDIDSTIDVVLKYQETLNNQVKVSLDDRFYIISKILVKSGH